MLLLSIFKINGNLHFISLIGGVEKSIGICTAQRPLKYLPPPPSPLTSIVVLSVLLLAYYSGGGGGGGGRGLEAFHGKLLCRCQSDPIVTRIRTASARTF